MEIITGIIIAVGAAFFGLQKMLRTWFADRTIIASDSAQFTVIEGLQKEIGRLQKQNEHLVKELTRMQNTTTEIVNKNMLLQSEIATLQSRVGELVRECERMSAFSTDPGQ